MKKVIFVLIPYEENYKEKLTLIAVEEEKRHLIQIMILPYL
ncbi:MAG: hypothetical protein ABIN61_01390 [candidate division WOR-3 bacterium]